MTPTHYISDTPLDFDTIQTIFEENYSLALSDSAKEKIVACRRYLDKKMETEQRPIYGITTGFGSLHNRSISKTELSQLQQNLLVSHAAGTGEPISPDIVKMMLFLKIHALAFGKSAVQLKTVQRLVDMFNEEVLPVVYDRGSLGASGDLAPLAHLFLPLVGMGDVNYKGQRVPAAQVLQEKNWEPVTLQSKEGLALLNGTQFMSAHGVWAILQGRRLMQIANRVAAISLDSFDGRLEPFLEAIHRIRPHKGQLIVSKEVRELLSDSELARREKQHVQDPYSFRCVPQVHGASYDALNYVAQVLNTEINSVTDNPTVFPNEDMIISGGNFHGQPLAISFDFLSIAMAELGSISERRIYRLIAGERGLPEFLVANPGLNSGFMIPQYTAASLVNQNKQYCTPSSIDSIPSSNEQEDHVSMGANGATKLLRVIDNVERILAIEFFNAAQALEFRRPARSSTKIEALVAAFRHEVAFIDEDRLMHAEIEKTRQFLYRRATRPLLE